jgi:predicted nucleotidyltransferase
MTVSISVPTLDVRKRIPGEAIQEIVDQIAQHFNPRQIILFGSYARGEPRPESDVDLLIIMETPMREAQQALEIRQFLKSLFGLDLLVYSAEKIEQRIALGDSFLKDIFSEGITVYESTHK